MFRIFFEIQDESVTVHDLDVTSNMNRCQWVVTRDHDTLQDGKKELQLFHDGISYPM